MQQCGTYSGDEIEHKELLRAPDPFEHGAEDEQGVHVEEDMPESPVHEHVSDYLPQPEIRRSRIVQGEAGHHVILVQNCHEHHQDIDDDDVLDGGRDGAEEIPLLCCMSNFPLFSGFS